MEDDANEYEDAKEVVDDGSEGSITAAERACYDDESLVDEDRDKELFVDSTPSPRDVHTLMAENGALRSSLKRRMHVIDTLRKSYLSDVVAIKLELMRKAGLSDKEYAATGGPPAEVRDAVPSADMRPVLFLYGPADTWLHVRPCESCGGQLEIITRESVKVTAAALEAAAKLGYDLRAELRLGQQREKEQQERFAEEKRFLLGAADKARRAGEAAVAHAEMSKQRMAAACASKLAAKDAELQEIPRLRAALAAAAASSQD
ncbi:unnamed protein product, partial [Phaeothamnion confervicola]